MLDVLDRIRRLDRGIGEGLLVRADGCHPDAAGNQEVDPVLGRARPHHGLDDAGDLLARWKVVRDRRVRRQGGQIQRVPQRLEPRHRQDEPAVARLVAAVRAGVEHAREAGRALGEPRAVQEVGDDLELEIERRPQHAHLDVKTLAGARPLEERGQHPHREKRRAVLIDDGRADGGRRLSRAAGDAREAREGLEEEILPRPVAIGARFSVSGGRDVDEPRVPRPRGLPGRYRGAPSLPDGSSGPARRRPRRDGAR